MFNVIILYDYLFHLFPFFVLENLHEIVDQYIHDELLQGIVHLKKTDKREGLIRARLFGANLATGQVIKGLYYFFIIIILFIYVYKYLELLLYISLGYLWYNINLSMK